MVSTRSQASRHGVSLDEGRLSSIKECRQTSPAGDDDIERRTSPPHDATLTHTPDDMRGIKTDNPVHHCPTLTFSEKLQYVHIFDVEDIPAFVMIRSKQYIPLSVNQ
jgi:hypothetical protein